METGKKDVELILALDGMSGGDLMRWSHHTAGRTRWKKLNDALDTPGPESIGWLKNEWNDLVFADAKLYDTHDTITNRVKKLVARGADSVSICAFMPMKSMKAAVAARGTADIWAVGVLSSITPEEWNKEYGLSYPVSLTVAQRSCFERACDAGVQGLICAPADLAMARAVLWYRGTRGRMKLIVPGTRSPGADKGQQARILTPAEAKELGATHLVVGSQVTKHKDPLGELARIYGELGQTMPGGPSPILRTPEA